MFKAILLLLVFCFSYQLLASEDHSHDVINQECVELVTSKAPFPSLAKANIACVNVNMTCVQQVAMDHPILDLNSAVNACKKVDMACVNRVKLEAPFPATITAVNSCKVEVNEACLSLAKRKAPLLSVAEIYFACDRVDINCANQLMAEYPFPEFVQAASMCKVPRQN